MQAGETFQAEVQAIINEINNALEDLRQPILQGQKLEILRCCLSHKKPLTYARMVDEIGGKQNALKQAGAALVKILESVTGKDIGNKNNCYRVVRLWYQELIQQRNTKIIGRQEDLSALSDAILGYGRLLCIYGPPSIGKTQLVTALRQRFVGIGKEDAVFDYELLWEIQAGSTVDDLYHAVQSLLFGNIQPKQTDAIAGLRQILRQQHKRLLLIIEGTDALYDPKNRDTSFNQDAISRGYERWLQLLTQTFDLHSCVIWVSRRRPSCLLVSGSHIYSRQLQPLKAEESTQLLQEELPQIPAQDLHQLAEFCGRNPGVLKIASLKMREEHYGSVFDMMHTPLQPEKYPEDKSWLQAVETLTLAEQRVLGWLALQPDHAIERDMEEDFRFTAYPLQSTMSALQQRGFVKQRSQGNYEIQSLWLQHVVARFFIERFANAFWQDASKVIEVLAQHPVMSPRSAAWKRRWCWQHILHQLPGALSQSGHQSGSWSQTERRKRFEEICASIQHNENVQKPWLIGTALTIAAALKLPLQQLTLSNMTIRYADLRDNRFQQVVFKECQFLDTALPIKMHGKLATAISPDGTALAVGDTSGHVLCWRLQNNAFQMTHFTRIQPESSEIPAGITHLAFGDERTLAIATEQQVYCWWLPGKDGFSNEKPVLAIQKLPAPVSCLSAQGEERIATGLETGDIVLWYELQGSIALSAHQTAVKTLAFSTDGSRLLSIGHGDRLVEWDITLDPISQERRSGDDLFMNAAFHQRCPVIAYATSSYDGSFRILMGNSERQEVPFKVNGALIRLSRNGQYLAVVVGENVRILSVSNLSSYKTIPADHMPTDVGISDDGQWLLTMKHVNNTTHVALWNVKTGQLWWDLQSVEDGLSVITPSTAPGLLFKQCQVNDSAAEQAYFIDYYGADFAS